METIQNLINQIFEETGEENTKLISQLQNQGRKIIDLLLSEFFARKKEGKLSLNPSLSHLLYEISAFFEPRHAQQVGEILTWNEVLSITTSLLEILERIGDSSVVHFLEEYASTVEQKQYADIFYRGGKISASLLQEIDRKEVEEVIIVCQER